MKIFILLFSVLFTTMSFTQAPNYVPANGLVGWWPFNGNANDESGNGNNGTNNGATLTTDRNGVANQAYSFDGNDFIQTSNQNLSGSVSFSGWYNMSSFNTPVSDMFFVSNQSLSTDIYSANIAFGFRSYQGDYGHSTYGLSPFTGYYATNNLPTTNVWHHIACVFENGSYIKMYLDNVLIYSNMNVLTNSLQASLPLLFGGTGTSSFYYYIGQLDDIGIWNRALTDCEIQNLYTSSNPTNTTTASACNSYTWNGTSYTASGVYTGTTTNCVTQSLNLTITPSSTITQPASQSISIGNNAQFIVGSSGSNAIYQWQTNLGFGFQNLNNAGQYNGTTSSTLSVTNLSMSNNNQVFRCIVSSGSCTDTSDVAVLTVLNNVGFSDLSASKLSIYPNPTNGDFTITGLELVGFISSLSITDMNGKVVKVLDTKATKFSMSSIKPGVYFLNIKSGNKQEVLKIVKE